MPPMRPKMEISQNKRAPPISTTVATGLIKKRKRTRRTKREATGKEGKEGCLDLIQELMDSITISQSREAQADIPDNSYLPDQYFLIRI